MRPKKPESTRPGDLFRVPLDQIINLKHEPAQLAARSIGTLSTARSPRSTATRARPGIPTPFVIGLLLLKRIYGCRMKACASAGSMNRTFSSSPERSSSSMSSRTSAPT
jgi:hypothetical protein